MRRSNGVKDERGNMALYTRSNPNAHGISKVSAMQDEPDSNQKLEGDGGMEI